MDLDDLKRWAKEWRITVDSDHFPQRARERDRSKEWIIRQFREGNIEGFYENPRPSDFVQYDRAVIVRIPKSSNYHYRIPTYIKENEELHLKSVLQQR
ncbi:MAG: hypothetical protein SVS85_01035 [Candidatus Nanohaloarchaea archaeon]|nr:hypothetical protein [Candidatus Nanohaloarchaea archaeon]